MATPFYGKHYKGLPVITSHGPLIEEYLERAHITLFRSINQHRRLMVVRIELRFPQGYWPIEGCGLGNDYITRFTESLEAKILHSQHLARSRGSRVHSASLRRIWAREYRLDWCKPHFHVILLLNRDAYHVLGDYFSDISNLRSRIIEAWASALGMESIAVEGRVHFPQNAVYHVHADSPESIADCFYRVSYLCKARSKNFHDGFHSFGNSRR